MRAAMCMLGVLVCAGMVGCQTTQRNSDGSQDYAPVSHEARPPGRGVDRDQPIHVRFHGVTYVRREKGGGLDFRIIPRMPDGTLFIPRDLEGDIELRRTLATYFTWTTAEIPPVFAMSAPTVDSACLEHLRFGSASAGCSMSGCAKSCGTGVAVSRTGQNIQFTVYETSVDVLSVMADDDIGSIAVGCTCN